MATVTAVTAMATATARRPRNDLASIKLRVSQKRGAHQPQTLTHLFPTTKRTDISPASHKHSGAWRAVRQRTDYSSFNTDWNGLNGLNGWDLFPFPRLTPLQPGSDVHPCKRACLPEPPHLSGLPCWQTERNQVTDASQRTWNPFDCFLVVVRGHVWHS